MCIDACKGGLKECPTPLICFDGGRSVHRGYPTDIEDYPIVDPEEAEGWTFSALELIALCGAVGFIFVVLSAKGVI